MSDALTQKDSMSRLMVEPVQAVRLWDSEVRSTQGGAVMRTETISREACESTLTRKGANNCEGARTANRRRWARRES